jgi:hypothetical protein
LGIISQGVPDAMATSLNPYQVIFMINQERINYLLEYQKWQIRHKAAIRGKARYLFMALLRNVFLFNFVYSHPKDKPCDILILYPSANIISRIRPFINLLKNKGFIVATDLTPTPLNALKGRLLARPDRNIPVSLKYFAAYAKYIIKTYRPPILITFMDASLFSPFLRDEMKTYGKVINIAHGFTASTWRFSMTDFDYYFLFGRKSLEALEVNEVRFGNTNIVLTGSVFSDDAYCLPETEPNKNVLFFSSWINHQHKDICLKNFDIVAGWAEAHPEYNLFVKLHPSEDTDYWVEKSKIINNIHVLDKKTDMKEALIEVSLTIVNWSAASIDSALLKRPFVIVNNSDMSDDYLNAEDFFLPRAKSIKELHDRILQTFDHYELFLQKCEEYTSFHLEKKQGAQEYIANTIATIINGGDVPSMPLLEKINELT